MLFYLKGAKDREMTKEISPLEEKRASYVPKIPGILKKGISNIGLKRGRRTSAISDAAEIKKLFPHSYGNPIVKFVKGTGQEGTRPLNVGVVLSGGQAPGGHNVIIGLFDGIKEIHPESRLFGFKGGPIGILKGKYVELTAEVISPYRNTGGFDMIGSGRDKIEKDEHFAASRQICESLKLDALVIIGGDDSNTNAAFLTEYFQKEGQKTCVIGVPKTIDGDLKGDVIEVSFGFDTACKLYSELIGNICRDAASACKYWHFVKLMGRNASHVTLECALQTHVNIALIGEEVNEKNMTLARIVEYVANVVKRRSEAGKDFGVCLVPEGLVEFIPEIRLLISELNTILAEHDKFFQTLKIFTDQQEFINQKLSKDSSYVFSSLPAHIQQQLLFDRDAHGNVQVSKIETEKFLMEQTGELLGEWKSEEKFSGEFKAVAHFLGYEGRCSAPSNFDANYTYALGRTAAVLAAFGITGYMCAVTNLASPASRWKAGGVPLTSLMNIETRKGKKIAVIKKSLVQMNGAPFQAFVSARERWEIEDDYVYPGAIQYFGPAEVCDVTTKTLLLEREK